MRTRSFRCFPPQSVCDLRRFSTTADGQRSAPRLLLLLRKGGRPWRRGEGGGQQRSQGSTHEPPVVCGGHASRSARALSSFCPVRMRAFQPNSLQRKHPTRFPLYTSNAEFPPTDCLLLMRERDSMRLAAVTSLTGGVRSREELKGALLLISFPILHNPTGEKVQTRKSPARNARFEDTSSCRSKQRCWSGNTRGQSDTFTPRPGTCRTAEPPSCSMQRSAAGSS